jgi:hypothetical protein
LQFCSLLVSFGGKPDAAPIKNWFVSRGTLRFSERVGEKNFCSA